MENVCKHRSALVAQWTCASNKRALGTKNESSQTFCKHFENLCCVPEKKFSVSFIYFKTNKHCFFPILLHKQIMDFQFSSSTFKALKSDS